MDTNFVLTAGAVAVIVPIGLLVGVVIVVLVVAMLGEFVRS